MTRSFPPAPRARAARSTVSDRLTRRRLRTAFVLARTSLLVLTGRVPVDAACGCDDRHRVEHVDETGRRLDVVLAGSSDDARPPQQQRTPSLCPPAQTMSSTLVVAGLIGLLGLYGSAASVVDSVAGPVRRAVRVLHAPEQGRRGRRLRPTTRHAFHQASRAVDTAGDDLGAAREIGEDAPSTATVPAVLTATPEVAIPAGVISAEAVTAATTPAACAVATTRYVAARSRALGPTTALWHAVQLDRLGGAIGGACETTVCGSLVRVSTDQAWPVPARDVCPACSTLAH